jgi:hypothetical protein
LEEIMTALSAALPVSIPPQIHPNPTHDRATLPCSFQEALSLGWSIVKEESSISIDDKRRKGVVLLRSKDAPVRLRIPYSATAKAWKFGTPEVIE